MRIVSWNVNGLRAVHRNGFWQEFLTLNADIYILQETKMEKEQLQEEIREITGYTSYWNSSKARKGYSGTTVFVRDELVSRVTDVIYDLPQSEHCQEGRLITLVFDTFVVSNGYFPNGGRGPEHVSYKMSYYEDFLSFINQYKGHLSVIWGGDVNTAHCPIDLARPKENENRTGFLPQERAWLDEVSAEGWIDTFRALNPDKIAYTWWDMKTRARERNVGWRIDYLFIDEGSQHLVSRATTHPSIYGSDHCPISIDVDIT